MSRRGTINANFIHLTIPLEYMKVYASILAALSDYGEDMLEDCKASCTDKDSGIIECFNMFNAGIAAYRLGEIKKAETIIKYVDSMLKLKYKNIIVPDNITFPVEEENLTVNFDFNNPPYFNMIEGIPVPVERIEIQGEDFVTGVSSRYTCIFTPDNTTETEIIWSIVEGHGTQYAFIDSQTGMLHVKQNANNSQVIVKATSGNNPDVYDTKPIICTYDNEAPGDITLIANTDIAEYNTQKQIIARVENALSTPIRLELYQIDDSDNIILINYVENKTEHTFNVTLTGLSKYFVKATFEDGTDLTSDILELNAVPCCYIGAGSNYLDVLSNASNKISPTLDIGSPIGKEYPFTVASDGLFLYIFTPVIEGHMNVNEIRMDATNLLDGFDMDYTVTDINVDGKPYKQYEVDLGGKGFKADNYRLLITS